jgi:hypothetical protein
VLIAAPAGGPSKVTLMDALATVAHGTIAHGACVEILAWQPAGPLGTRYRVRSSKDGLEGWLSGRQLQACAAPVVARQRKMTVSATSTTKPATAPKRVAGRK